MANQTLRTFVALPLSPEIESQLDEIQRALRRRCPDGSVRWVRPEAIHLTLFFIGDVLEERIEPIREALAVVARNVPPFEFGVGGVGAFPKTSRPRVLWVGVQDSDERLALLYRAINEAMENVGFQPEDRPFNPHLTLGRVSRRADRDDRAQISRAVEETDVGDLGTIRAGELILFRSDLKPTGAEYTRLFTFPLEAA